MKKFPFILLLCSVVLLFCSCKKKNYSVDVSDGTVWVKMRSPTIGIVGINEVDYDGFTYEDVEEEVFDKIRNRNFYGDYSVIVTLEFQDSYGNYYDGPPVTVGSLNGAEVKRYASYGYFKGSSHIADAFPWNHKY
ncbi:hypothetical protein [Alloprevotella tannerae]|uniref:hypothetical protein n=1 Tax=Alloprevotella tannerae TaxID=76122 RepID=UPI0028EDE049|nr:hypothetical protein [Alloprevotella tannerae]